MKFIGWILLLFICWAQNVFAQQLFDAQKAKTVYAQAKLDVFAPNTQKHPLFSAHRGSQAFGPENTIITFEAAGKHKVWAIETDFRMTKDSVVVCMHDATLDRTTMGTGAVKDYTYAQLQDFVVKEVNSTTIPNKCYDYSKFSKKKLRIPTMDEYFAICAKYKCVPFIELKEDGGVIDQMLVSIKKHGLEGSCVISSSNIKLLKKIRQKGCMELIHHIASKVDYIPILQELGNAALAFNVKDFSLSIRDKYIYKNYNPATPKELVDMCHKEGLKVCFRAADSREAALDAIQAGADYLPTNTMWPARM